MAQSSAIRAAAHGEASLPDLVATPRPSAPTPVTPLPVGRHTAHGMIQHTCLFCGGHPSGIVGAKDGFRILRCGGCALQFSEYVPEPMELPELYDEYYFHGSPIGYPAYDRDEELHRERGRAYLRDLARRVPAGRLLDVGCATGYFLDEARQAGWEVRGWEVSEWAASRARERFGLDVTVGAFPGDTAATDCFDAVTFFNVLEQLPDPRATEAALRRMVRPGGLVALETWDAEAAIVKLLGMRWHQYRPKDTPFYLGRRSLEALFSPEHWRLVEFRGRTKWISLRHGLHVLGLTKSATPAPGRKAGLLEVHVPYRLGDLVWVVLERRGDAR